MAFLTAELSTRRSAKKWLPPLRAIMHLRVIPASEVRLMALYHDQLFTIRALETRVEKLAATLEIELIRLRTELIRRNSERRCSTDLDNRP